MGFWLWKYFKSRGLTDQLITGTDIFNLPKHGIISNLLLEFQAMSGSANIDKCLGDAILKVEVIGNGSTVIQSLDGRQIQASAAYDDLKMPPDKELSPEGMCWAYFDIRFGRYPGDQKYALDCSKWDSLELKITYDLKAGGTIGVDGFKTTTGYTSVYGLYSPDAAGLAPVGYIKKAEKKVYTTSTGGSEDLPLPTDYPYRRLLLVSETRHYNPYDPFSYVTININNGARKPIDNMIGNDLMILALAIMGNPLWRYWKRMQLATGSVPFSLPIRWATEGSLGIQGVSTNVYFNVFDMASQAVALAAATYVSVGISGYCPWGALIIDLERQSGKDGREAMEDCWGYDQTADIHLLHTQATKDLASSIVLEQYASHPA